jgi:hypothetical protein
MVQLVLTDYMLDNRRIGAALVNMVVNIRVPYKPEYFLIIWVTFNLCKECSYHEVN